MGEELKLKTVNFGPEFSWEEVQKILEENEDYRLPDIGESIIMDFKHMAIWIEETIGEKKMVMDNHWGPQIVRDGKYGLILVEKQCNI